MFTFKLFTTVTVCSFVALIVFPNNVSANDLEVGVFRYKHDRFF